METILPDPEQGLVEEPGFLPGSVVPEDGPDWASSEWAHETEGERLRRLHEMATEANHPAIDPEAIETQLGFVNSGRFTHAHYISMWATRLAEMGIAVESTKGAQEQLADNAAAAAAAAANAAARAAELAAPKPPPHPMSLRLQLQDKDIGDAYNVAVDSLLELLPYVTQIEQKNFRGRLRRTMTRRLEYDALRDAISTATKYYGMYRVQIENKENPAERSEFHFTDRDKAAGLVVDLWDLFHAGIAQARRLKLACGAQNLGENFNETMEQLLEQLWGADEELQEAFVVAVRRGLQTDEIWDSVTAAPLSGEEEYGYRCMILNGARGPQKFHVTDVDAVTSLLEQLEQHFLNELDRRNWHDLRGGDADADTGADGETADADSELGDLQAIMGALAPLSGEALLVVAHEKEKEAQWNTRLPSWGARFLVGDLLAQATWLRVHDAYGAAGLSELASTASAAYAFWLFGGFASGFHWLYLSWRSREQRREWVKESRRAAYGPPPPPHLICGLTGKVMDDPHTIRTHAKGVVAADTAHSKMLRCTHTFSGQALYQFLTQERKCPRCGIKPYTLNPKQTTARSLLYRNQVYDAEIRSWFAKQLGLGLDIQSQMPPTNTWLCLRHVAIYWVANLGFWASREWAHWFAVECADPGIKMHDCLWTEQSIEVQVLYTLHLALLMVILAHWSVDAISLRHVARQVVAGDQVGVTFCCTENKAEAWCYVVILLVFWVCFAAWSWDVILT